MLSKISPLLISGALAGKCPFGHTSSPAKATTTLAKLEKEKKDKGSYLVDLFTCPSGSMVTKTVSSFSASDYASVAEKIWDLYEAYDADDKSRFGGCLVRLAGHDFMDFRNSDLSGNGGSTSGGSDGCINLDDEDHTGLESCIAATGLADAYEHFCTELSLPDFIVIAAEAIMGRLATDFTSTDDYFNDGKLGKRFRDNFRMGRSLSTKCSWAEGLMPNPANSCDGLESIFVDEIFKGNDEAWTLTAAISGAHTLGAAQISNSGYDGYWSDKTNQNTFNNDYYLSILTKGWTQELAVNGNEAKN
jgi:hypothetical protein